jgi:hypothetical protein
MFVSEAGAYPRVEHLEGSSLLEALALTTKTRLGREGLSGTNTLVYYGNP